MEEYYTSKLSAEKLKRCYEVAPPRTVEYLESELQYVLDNISPDSIVLELGCGYGRILAPIARNCKMLVGIDTSYDSLQLALEQRNSNKNIHLLQMNAIQLGFPSKTFDVSICIQNGISAFKVDPKNLMYECIRVTKPGGYCLFSSYSRKFWKHRLKWFEIQSDEGLLGEIDWSKTKDGLIVCKDGFRSTTYSPEEFLQLASHLKVDAQIVEVNESSVFCKICVQ